MNDKIKVKFWRFDNLVVMRVLDMPERYRGKFTLDSGKGYSIVSMSSPEISDTTLYLRGNNQQKDNDYAFLKYETAEEAKGAIDKFSRMIRELNEEDCECPDEGIEPEVTTAE